jgi:hypothetical protein
MGLVGASVPGSATRRSILEVRDLHHPCSPRYGFRTDVLAAVVMKAYLGEERPAEHVARHPAPQHATQDDG